MKKNVNPGSTLWFLTSITGVRSASIRIHENYCNSKSNSNFEKLTIVLKSQRVPVGRKKNTLYNT